MCSNLVWIYWLILVVMTDNIGIWSEHHHWYPWSPPEPRDTRPIPPSPSLDTYKLLLENNANCWPPPMIRDWCLSLGRWSIKCNCAPLHLYSLHSAWLRSWGMITVRVRSISVHIRVATFEAPRFTMMLNPFFAPIMQNTLSSIATSIQYPYIAFNAFRNVVWWLAYHLIEARLVLLNWSLLFFVASCLCVPLTHIPWITRLQSLPLSWSHLFCLQYGNFEMPRRWIFSSLMFSCMCKSCRGKVSR